MFDMIMIMLILNLARLRMKNKNELLHHVLQIYNFGREVFRKKEYLIKWLSTPNRALGGEIPLNILDTKQGFKKVENLLGQIEYGIYS